MAFASPPSQSATRAPVSGKTRYTDYPMAMSVLTTIFFMWGFLTVLNDILIPHLKSVFELNYARAMLVQFTFFGAYFLMSLPAGRLVAALGYKKGIVAGLAIAAVGAFGFWPAATLHSYAAFLAALFVLATGITVLQVAANPYVALLGPERTSSSRLTLAQAMNSLGTTLGPWFGGLLILSAVTATTIPTDVRKAPETVQLVQMLNTGEPKQVADALRHAPADRLVAALNDAAATALDRVPADAVASAVAPLSSAQLAGVLDKLPGDALLATLSVQSPQQLAALPIDHLAGALDKLTASRLDDAQATRLRALRASLLPETQQQLQSWRQKQAELVQVPYVGLGVVLLLLAAGVWLFNLPALAETTEQADPTHHTLMDALRHSHVFFGVLAIFFYVGAEVSIGSFLVNYLSLPDVGHMSEQEASHYVSMYWGGAMIGRLAGSALLVWFNPRKLLALFAAIAGLLVLTTMLTHGQLAMASVIAIGLFNSIMFPTIFSLGIERMGPLTGKASSLLIMAIVGGALLPLAQGFLADHFGIQHAFVLPMLCYGYIVFYGLRGSLVRDAAVPAVIPENA
ncbi:MAG TPA: sugar MFS transporter [Dyella sp.]|uniref:sugar MFS transporter n=1 Tax=Dyella sp. TaxID=1869338 RepID=UPI002D765B60|nr:sugar MFS transporter [Dyella sp.]HET6553679.1 sugar MFS transporter [Dyella sp.]